MAAVVIGVEPHKLSATIEVLDEREQVLGEGRSGTDRDGCRQMLAAQRRWPNLGFRSGSSRCGSSIPPHRLPSLLTAITARGSFLAGRRRP